MQKKDETTEEEGAMVVLRKKEFLERVVAASGAKRAVARSVTEAVLKELGAALSQGENLVLPPLGKVRVKKQVDRSGGEMLQVNIKRATGSSEAEEGGEKTDDTPLAEAEN
ncbi:MAG: HU family DNA-binding protein [Paenirhodobacter sp.]|uniref:HU family DNA-binding protein n=1 Tax=Paenirhodobacter sp. TaxID=1965326 RepID=UPI003D1193F2